MDHEQIRTALRNLLALSISGACHGIPFDACTYAAQGAVAIARAAGLPKEQVDTAVSGAVDCIPPVLVGNMATRFAKFMQWMRERNTQDEQRAAAKAAPWN
jgi:hypothetical protein